MQVTDLRFSESMEPYRTHLIKRGCVIVGYSGGADSSCLLALLAPWCSENGIRIAAAHVNHGIRGDDADRDEDFCRRICSERGIPFYSTRINVPSIAAAEKTGIEETARRVRYAFFDEVSEKLTGFESGAVIATAHNADDNLETVLFHLLRGSGLRGLCGIDPFRENRYLRPLLGVSGKEIRRWCAENGIAYVTDATNDDTDYTRNYIRQNIVPSLSGVTPDPTSAAARMTSVLRQDCDFLESEAAKYVTGSAIPRSTLLTLHPAIASRVIRILYDHAKDSSASLEEKHIRNALTLVRNGNSGAAISLPGKMQLVLDGESVCIRPDRGRRTPVGENTDRESRTPDIPVFSGIERSAVFENRAYTVQFSRDHHNNHNTDDKINENIYKLSILTTLRFDKILGALRIRYRLPGDTIRTGGMTHKVKRLFCDSKMSVSQRELCPILYDDNGIIWIPGFPPRDGMVYTGEGEPLYIRCRTLSE